MKKIRLKDLFGLLLSTDFIVIKDYDEYKIYEGYIDNLHRLIMNGELDRTIYDYVVRQIMQTEYGIKIIVRV